MSADKGEEEELRRRAAEWCVVMASGNAGKAEKAGFAEWVTASPRHLEEYAALESLWDEAARFGPWLGHDTRVVSLYPMRRSPMTGRLTPAAPRPSRALAALLAILAILAIMTVFLLGTSGPSGDALLRYTTVLGENRLLTLEDGSLVELNTDSAVTVDYNAERRLLQLESGEGFFTVRKDPARPFIVRSGATEVRAVGTAFNVKAVDDALSVTVLEGAVLVSGNDDDPADGVEDSSAWQRSLSADRQLVVRKEPAGAALVERDVAARLITSWRHNKLSFTDAPLGEVVADFNRYNRRRILLAGENLGGLRISGTFDPRDPDAFARTVAKIAGLRLSDGVADKIILSPL